VPIGNRPVAANANANAVVIANRDRNDLVDDNIIPGWRVFGLLLRLPPICVQTVKLRVNANETTGYCDIAGTFYYRL
jgi:hypothetical protein